MDAKEYWNLLEKHDWFFDYSDDIRVFKKGNAERNYLIDLMSKDKELSKLYKAYYDFIFF